MPSKDTPIAITAKGLVSGAGSALALTAIVNATRTVISALDGSKKPPTQADGEPRVISAGEALSESPELPPGIDEMTAVFVQKVATGLFGTTLDTDQQYLAGTAWHLTYGSFWGALYSIIQSSTPAPKFLLGPLYGLGVWALGPGWLVPKMKIILSPTEQDRRTTLLLMAGHAAYGALLAASCSILERK